MLSLYDCSIAFELLFNQSLIRASERARTMQRFVLIFVSILICTAMPKISHAGAWSLPEGKGQIISTTTYDQADRFFDREGKLRSPATFSKIDTTLFIEHGLSERFTLVGATAYQDVDYIGRNGREQFSGFGESQIGLRYQAYRTDKSVGSVQLSYIVATNGENIPDADLGNGADSFEIRGLLGRSFNIIDKPAFADIQGAWRHRSGNNPDEWRGDITIGVRPSPKILIMGQVFYVHNGSRDMVIDRILSNESLKLQGSLVYDWKPNRSVQIGAFQTIAGRNVVQEKAVFIGVWQRYDSLFGGLFEKLQ